jgi:hypothetical protein
MPQLHKHLNVICYAAAGADPGIGSGNRLSFRSVLLQRAAVQIWAGKVKLVSEGMAHQITNGFMQLRREVVAISCSSLFIFGSGKKLSIEQKNLS